MIRWETRGAVGLAIIDRQERRNALNAELCDQLRGRLVENASLGAVVITGTGTAFCAGADLVTRFEPSTADAGPATDMFRPAFELLTQAIVDYPGAVLAAVHGSALGAGMQLAVACDLRVAGPDARFGIPAAKLGIMLSPANIHRLVLLVGQGAARDVLMTGRTFDRDAAASIGLVQRAAPDAVAAALEWADEIAGLAPLAVSGHKRALNLIASASNGLDEPTRDEIRALEERAFASADLQEGLAAFTDKRPPRFEGR